MSFLVSFIKNFFKIIFNLAVGNSEEIILYALLVFSLVLFDVTFYYTFAEQINKHLLISLLWFGMVLFSSLVIFRFVIAAARESFRENMSLFEVVAFIEAKRRSEELKKQGKNPKFIVAGEEEEGEKEKEKGEEKKKEGFLLRLLGFLPFREKKKEKKKQVQEERKTETVCISAVQFSQSQLHSQSESSRPKLVEQQVQVKEQAQVLEKSEAKPNQELKQEVHENSQEQQLQKAEQKEEVAEARAVEDRVQEVQQEVQVEETTARSSIADQEDREEQQPKQLEQSEEPGIEQAKKLFKLFAEVTQDDKVLDLVTELYGLYLNEPDMNSLGFEPSESQSLKWKALKQIPLYEHVLNVVEEAVRLADKQGLQGLEKLALMLSALVHDLGKLTTVVSSIGVEERKRKVKEHPNYGYQFLMNFFREKEREQKLPFAAEWFEAIAEAVKYHHTVVPQSKPVWFELLKRADWEARSKESGLTEQEIKEFYKEIFADYSLIDEEQAKEFVITAFRKAIVDIIKDYPSYAYPLRAGIPESFFGVDESGKAFIYIDPENLLNSLVSFSKEFKKYAEGFRTKLGKDKQLHYNNDLKRFVAFTLSEAGYADLERNRYSNQLVFDSDVKMSRVFSVGDKKAIMAIPLKVDVIAQEAGRSISEIINAVNDAVRKRPSSYYIGTAKDEHAERLLYIPSKELVEELGEK